MTKCPIDSNSLMPGNFVRRGRLALGALKCGANVGDIAANMEGIRAANCGRRRGREAVSCNSGHTGLWRAQIWAFAVAVVTVSIGVWAIPVAAQAPAKVGASGLPLPRYVSLKSDRVNLRKGPGTEYPTAWVYRRAGLPVEVVEEYESWRKVRDAEGTTGWILSALLSGRRTALVLPWELKSDAARPQVALRTSDSERAQPVAMIEAGVIADVQSCDGAWCYVTIQSFRGYLEQKKLWGVYANEQLN